MHPEQSAGRPVERRRGAFPHERPGAGRLPFSTASAIVFVIPDNKAVYGTIRMHQERHYPRRVYGTDLVESGFRGARARAYGAMAKTVVRTENLRRALDAR